MAFPLAAGQPFIRRRRRSRTLGITLMLVATCAASAVRAAPAHADSLSAENRFVELINASRAAGGLPVLSVHPALISSGRTWANKMLAASSAAGGSGCLISHNPELRTAVAASWRKLGENVGCGDVDVDVLHQKFMDSPAHKANIMDPEFDSIGIGVVYDSTGMMWVTEQFMDLDERAQATTTAPSVPIALALAPTAKVKGLTVSPNTTVKRAARPVRRVTRR